MEFLGISEWLSGVGGAVVSKVEPSGIDGW